MRRDFLLPTIACSGALESCYAHSQSACAGSVASRRSLPRRHPLWIGSLTNACAVLPPPGRSHAPPRARLPRVCAASRLAGLVPIGTAPPRTPRRCARLARGVSSVDSHIWCLEERWVPRAPEIRANGLRSEIAPGWAASVFLLRGPCLRFLCDGSFPAIIFV